MYSLFCPEILKDYHSYSEFREHSKTILQVHSAMKKMVWSNSDGGVIKKYRQHVMTYFDHYCGISNLRDEILDDRALTIFDDTKYGSHREVTNNAFYFAQELANGYNSLAIKIALICYALGLILISIIAIQNFLYVLQTLF